MLCVAAMSWSGLYGWARTVLAWPEATAWAVPVSLDIAALTCALLALDTVSRNDPATGYRTLTAVFVGLSAFVNWRYRLNSHNVAEEIFFPAMSILAYALIDTTIRKYRRDSRRDRAGEEARQAPNSLTRYGLLTWLPGLGHPGRAWTARRVELAGRIPTPVALDVATVAQPVASVAPPAEPRLIVLAELSQAAAIRHAIEVTNSTDPGSLVAWLAEHGRDVARQRVCDQIRRDGLTSSQPRLTALHGGQENKSA